jgi:hypothetical protein
MRMLPRAWGTDHGKWGGVAIRWKASDSVIVVGRAAIFSKDWLAWIWVRP